MKGVFDFDAKSFDTIDLKTKIRKELKDYLTKNGLMIKPQAINKIKGTAMQKILVNAFKNREEDISVNKIMDIIGKSHLKFYKITKPFRLNGREFDKDNFPIILDSHLPFNERNTIYSKKNKKEIKPLWYRCDRCGRVSYVSLKRIRKCPFCRRGHLRPQITFNDQWRLLAKWVSKDEAIEIMEEEGIIKRINIKSGLKRRVDFFKLINGKIYIFESKNKEVSGVQFTDILKTIIYPWILILHGVLVKEVTIIFNGYLSPSFEDGWRRYFEKMTGVKLIFKRLSTFLSENNISVSQVIVQYSEEGYHYKIIRGTRRPIILFLHSVRPNTISDNKMGGNKGYEDAAEKKAKKTLKQFQVFKPLIMHNRQVLSTDEQDVKIKKEGENER